MHSSLNYSPQFGYRKALHRCAWEVSSCKPHYSRNVRHRLERKRMDWKEREHDGRYCEVSIWETPLQGEWEVHRGALPPQHGEQRGIGALQSGAKA
jgi:hypothetical protein